MEATINITNGEVYAWYISVCKGLSVKETCKTFKEKFELPGYQQQSDTRLFSKLQTLDKKVKSLKRKKNETGACAQHLLKEFVIVSESNALRSTNAAVSDKELHLSRELSKSNLERKKLKRKVTGLEKEVEMVDILTANCDVALSHLDCAKKKVQ